MTYGKRRVIGPQVPGRRGPAIVPQGNMKHIAKWGFLVTGLAVTGCAGGGNFIDEAVPRAAFGQAEPASAPAPQEGQTADALMDAPSRAADPAAASDMDPVFSGSGAANITGVYPNMNVEPRGATAQMTDEQRDVLYSQMRALATAHASGQVSTADYERRLAVLRKLAESHSLDTIEKIEK